VEEDKAMYFHVSMAMPIWQTLRSGPDGWFRSRNFSRRKTAASLRKLLCTKMKAYNVATHNLGPNEALLGPSNNIRPSSAERQVLLDKDDFICEFYNVLWIERKDGIAYRRACGWVPKHIWEAHATGPVEIKLG
jgi:hypothetical protein